MDISLLKISEKRLPIPHIWVHLWWEMQIELIMITECRELHVLFINFDKLYYMQMGESASSILFNLEKKIRSSLTQDAWIDFSLPIKKPNTSKQPPQKSPKHQPTKTPASLRLPFVVFSDFLTMKTTFRGVMVTVTLHHVKSSD